MRLFAPPFRFLFIILGGWIAARATYLNWPELGVAPSIAALGEATGSSKSEMAGDPLAPSSIAGGDAVAAEEGYRPHRARLAATAARPLPGGAEPGRPRIEAERGHVDPVAAPAGFAMTAPSATSRWSAYAYVFRREGSGQGLAAGGQLGGSQAGARLAYRLTPADGPRAIAAMARFAAPLRGPGAEAALGLEASPIHVLPIRLTFERRMALDRGGRDAFAAYAAGGFYREPRPGLILDGYGQAGMVGLASRDLFADGMVRAARSIGPVRLGGGVWGAAQPGVSRLDIGPRVAGELALGKTSITASAEWRMRIAGDARPGNGLAITLAAGF